MLVEMIELCQKMKEQMKATQREIKQNIQGTNSEGKETRTQSNDLEQKEEIKIQPEQNGETRIQKNEADFSKETSQARRGWKEVFEVMKGKDLHPR